MSKAMARYLAGISFFLLVLAAPLSRAAIPTVGHIQADIQHPFVVGNTTLPPGKYDFRMLPRGDQGLMRVSNLNDTITVLFLVRPSIDSHVPNHAELVFNRYGKTEILKKIYEAGSRHGVAIAGVSQEEARLLKQGEKPEQHTEEQAQ